MKALIFQGIEDLAVTEVDDPEPRAAADAVVKVSLAGMCGSDLHIYHGRESGLDAGTVMGHEFVGEVVAVGKDVKLVSVGERVCSPFTTSCGSCFYCRSALTCRCEHSQTFGWVADGQGLHGTQAEYVRVPLADATLMPIPDGVSDEDALLLGDNLSSAFFGAEMAEVRPDRVYAVIGCGTVGLLAILACSRLGAEQLVAVDPLASRRSLAEQLGAQACPPETAQHALYELTAGRGADAVLELVGSPAAQQLAVALIRPGGILSTVGVHTARHFAFSPVEAYDKNLTYKTGRCPARSYMEQLMPLLEEQSLDLSSLITHRLPLTQGVQAYDMFSKREDNCIKIVLSPGSL